MISQHNIGTLREDQIKILAENGCDFASSNGMIMKDENSLPKNVNVFLLNVFAVIIFKT